MNPGIGCIKINSKIRNRNKSKLIYPGVSLTVVTSIQF